MWIAIAAIIGVLLGTILGFLTCAILTTGTVADKDSFSQELGEVIVKQRKRIDELELNIKV